MLTIECLAAVCSSPWQGSVTHSTPVLLLPSYFFFFFFGGSSSELLSVLLLLLLEELESDSKSEEEEELLEEGEEEEEELLSSLSLSEEEEEEEEESSLSEEESLAELSLLLLLELVTLLDLRENRELSTALPEPVTHRAFPLLCCNNPKINYLKISTPHHRNFQVSPPQMNPCALPSLLHSWPSAFGPFEQCRVAPGHDTTHRTAERGRQGKLARIWFPALSRGSAGLTALNWPSPGENEPGSVPASPLQQGNSATARARGGFSRDFTKVKAAPSKNFLDYTWQKNPKYLPRQDACVFQVEEKGGNNPRLRQNDEHSKEDFCMLCTFFSCSALPGAIVLKISVSDLGG